MGRELQKRKNRSSRATVTMPRKPKKALNPTGSNIVAQNWNHKETARQNYARFGLVAKLGTTAGGTSSSISAKLRSKIAINNSSGGSAGVPASKVDSLDVRSGDRGLLQVGEVKVERDATGRIVRVLRAANPLHDPLNAMDDDDDEDNDSDDDMADGDAAAEEWGGFEDDEDDEDRPSVVRELEREANRPVERPVRHQSSGESAWLERLVARHGSDTAAMARDRKINPMQQTQADIAKRLRKAGLLQA